MECHFLNGSGWHVRRDFKDISKREWKATICPRLVREMRVEKHKGSEWKRSKKGGDRKVIVTVGGH